MRDLPWIICLSLCMVVGLSVTEWRTLSALDQKRLVPLNFLKYPHLYDYAHYGLLALCATLLILLTENTWYEIAGGVFGTWGLPHWLGRRAAFETIRKDCRRYLHDEVELQKTDPEQFRQLSEEDGYEQSRANVEEFSQKTNAEFAKMLKTMR